MNNNSHLLYSKIKCNCVENLINKCFKNNTKKKISDQNSELSFILKKKKDFLKITQRKELNLDTTLKNSKSLMKNSTTRINILSNFNDKILSQNSKKMNTTQKKIHQKKKSNFFTNLKIKFVVFFVEEKIVSMRII